jgi:hypothetical protein
MVVEHIHILMDIKLIFHSIHVLIHILQNSFRTLVNVVMVLLYIKHRVAMSMLKKAIIGILHLLLHAKIFFLIIFSYLSSIKRIIVDNEEDHSIKLLS